MLTTVLTILVIKKCLMEQTSKHQNKTKQNKTIRWLETSRCGDSRVFEHFHDFLLPLNPTLIAYFIKERLIRFENLLQIHFKKRQDRIHELHDENLEMILRADHVFAPRLRHNHLLPTSFSSLPASRRPARLPAPSPFPSNVLLAIRRFPVRIRAAPRTAAR